jgi:nitrate reductase gamma subunit
MRWIAVPMLVLAALYIPSAFAQDAGAASQGLCKFAGFLKQIATVAAIIGLILFVLNSFFMKSSVVGDIIMYIIIGCAIMVAGPYLITLTGLTSNCSI